MSSGGGQTASLKRCCCCLLVVSETSRSQFSKGSLATPLSALRFCIECAEMRAVLATAWPRAVARFHRLEEQAVVPEGAIELKATIEKYATLLANSFKLNIPFELPPGAQPKQKCVSVQTALKQVSSHVLVFAGHIADLEKELVAAAAAPAAATS